LGSEDAELAGESVAIRVESATALAFGSGGARGMVRARSVLELLASHIVFLPFANKNGPLSAAGHYGRRFAFPTKHYHEGCAY